MNLRFEEIGDSLAKIVMEGAEDNMSNVRKVLLAKVKELSGKKILLDVIDCSPIAIATITLLLSTVGSSLEILDTNSKHYVRVA